MMAINRIYSENSVPKLPIGHSVATLTYTGEINDSFLLSLVRFFNEHPGIDEYVININSGGGLVVPGIAAYNFLKNQNTCVVRTNNMGEVSSAAILPYLGGRIRTAATISRFVFHPVSLPVSGSYSLPKLEETMRIVEQHISDYATIVRKELPLFCEEHQIDQILRHDTFIVTPEVGRKYGLIRIPDDT